MSWKIVKSIYDSTDHSTLHNDELIAIELALRKTMGEPQNEYNPSWRAWRKIRPLALECSADGDPMQGLPPGAVGEPNMRNER